MLSLLTGKLGVYLAIALAIGAFGGYMYYRGGVTPRAERDAAIASFKAFQAQVAELGKEAAKKAADKEKADKTAKEQADAKFTAAQSNLDDLYAAYRRMRQPTAGGSSPSSLLPAPTAGAANPQRACFDRAGLDNALSGFDSAVTGLLEEGDHAIVGLNAAKSWSAQTLR